jgi:signal transduction histidine kinase
MYIRTRLALWFMLMLAVVLGAFSWTIYQLTRSNLLAEIDRDVRQRATMLANDAQPGSGATRPTLPRLDISSMPDTYLELLDSAGNVLARSGNLADRSLPFDLHAIASGSVTEGRLGNVPLSLFGRPVTIRNNAADAAAQSGGQGAGQVVGYVLVARTPRTIYAAMGQLQGFLIPGVMITLILAGLATWLLVRRTMSPLERLSANAAEIAAAKDHTRRLLVRGPSDEINMLANTINGMLAALEDAYRQVHEAHDVQRQFLADVSHELRTPLTIMLSSLDLIGKVGAIDAAFQEKALADMRVETGRMARMVTQLLILARSDASAAMANQPVLLADILDDICRQVKLTGQWVEGGEGTGESSAGNGHMGEGGARLECKGLDALESAVVWGNADYLRQLFLILLDNAMKYTPAGGTVEITATLHGRCLEVAVIDNGIGIAAVDMPRVFARFFRAGNARYTSGAGLGLSIAQRIAEQHGGKIRVESELGAGSCFTVTLPLLGEANGLTENHHLENDEVWGP